MTAIQEILKSIKSVKSKGKQLSKNELLSVLEATKTISEHKNFINSLILFFTTINSNQNYNTNLLTNRELQILNLIGNGKESKFIAKDLGLQISTVETHRKNIRKKLGLVGKGKLLKFAIYNTLNQKL